MLDDYDGMEDPSEYIEHIGNWLDYYYVYEHVKCKLFTLE